MTGAGSTERRGMRAVLRVPQFRRLLAAQTVSQIGDFVYVIALGAYVLEKTGSVAWVSAAALARMLPYILFGTIGGAVAGRYDRRRLLVLFDLVRAATMVVLALVVAADGPAAVVIALAGLTSVSSAVWRPAAGAAVPAVVEETDLAAANGLQTSLLLLATFLGPALGAVIFAVSSAEVAFAVNAATFVLSAVLMAGVAAAGRAAASEGGEGGEGGGAESGDESKERLADEVLGGWRAARAAPGMVWIFVLSTASVLAYGFEVVVYPLISDQRLGTGPEGAGYLLGAIGIGGLLAAPISGRVAASRHAGTWFALSAVMLGAPFVLLAFVESQAIAYPVLLAEGVGVTISEVVAITFIQRLITGDDLARVLGLQDSVLATMTFVGMLAAPVLVSTVDLRAAIVVGGGACIVLGLVALPRLRAIGHLLHDQGEAVREKVDVLAALGLFEGASRAALERMAASIRVEARPVGDVIIRQDDEPDDMYVVREGTVALTARDERGVVQELPSFGPGDWFGELGLLHGTKRLGTLVAETPVVLWRIDGRAFLDAMTAIDGRPAGRHLTDARLIRTHPTLALAP